MRFFEINGNLEIYSNYDNFKNSIIIVREIFINEFGLETMDKIGVLVDNATKGSGLTPIITPVLQRFLVIKLGIEDFSNTEQIIFQFSHELCHYVFYALQGLDKKRANIIEENICTAMSLAIISLLCPESLEKYVTYVENLSDINYNLGVKISKQYHFDIHEIGDYINKVCI